MDKTLKFLKEITDLNGVPGNEKQVRDYMKKQLEGVAEHITQDNLGSVIASKKGLENGPKIMVAGHMDEVGFIVTRITPEGFLKFQPLGGWWSQVMLAQQFVITTHKGNVFAVTGSKPPHMLSADERNKTVDIATMYLDIGVTSKEEAESLGVRPGDMVTPYLEFKALGNGDFLLAKAWDNRIGCAVAIEVMRELKNQEHPNTYYAVGTVQEEVGCRGARTASYVINPDIGISVDVGIGNDVPGGEKEGMELGKGPQIHLLDAGTIGHKGLREFVCKVADELEIPYQVTFLKGGGTDASQMHLAHDGAPSISVGIASRYIHSHTSMIHRKDYENTVKLIVEVIKRLDKKTVEGIIYE